MKNGSLEIIRTMAIDLCPQSPTTSNRCDKITLPDTKKKYICFTPLKCSNEGRPSVHYGRHKSYKIQIGVKSKVLVPHVE